MNLLIPWVGKKEAVKLSGSSEYPFIVIEGVDGSGKTTAAWKIARNLGAVYFKTPSGVWGHFRNLADRHYSWLRFCYYFAATICASFQIRRLLKSRPVICDRFIHSTWAHHMAEGCRLPEVDLLNMLPVKAPDAVFYLYASRTERARRVAGRKDNTPRDYDVNTLEKVHSFFMAFSCLLPVNTSFMDEQEIAEKIIDVLRHKGLAAGKS